MKNVSNESRVSNLNPAQRGGQASLGLFGCGPSITGAPRRAFRELADDQTRRIGGLTAGQRKARLFARVGAPMPVAYASTQPAPVLSFEELMAKYKRPAKVAQAETTEASARKATPAMLANAAASDMREAFPQYPDDEAADFAHRCAGAGYVETTLAREEA